MANAPKTLRHDGIAFAIGALFVFLGISVVHDAVASSAYTSNWIFGVCNIVFGSMIVGVAINHISVGRRAQKKRNNIKGGINNGN